MPRKKLPPVPGEAPKRKLAKKVLKPGSVDGRPLEYTPEIGKYICDKISTGTVGLRKLALNDDKFPQHETIARWLIRREDFRVQYNQARRHRTELQMEELIDSIDELEQYQFQDEKGANRLDGGIVSAMKLKVDTKKWIASKVLPKIYGDKIELDHLKNQNEDMMKELLELRAELTEKNKKDY